MRLIDKVRCPECRSTRTEEHGTNPGDFNWWLCRDCGFNWPTKENDDEKGCDYWKQREATPWTE